MRNKATTWVWEKCGKTEEKGDYGKQPFRKLESKCTGNYNMVSLPVWQIGSTWYSCFDFSFLQPTIGTGAGEVQKWNMMRFFFFKRVEEVRNKQSSVLLCKYGTLDLFMMFIYFDGILAICELFHDITYRSIWKHFLHNASHDVQENFLEYVNKILNYFVI